MKKIAVVDDSEDNIILLEALLRDRYDVISFDNGIDALKKFEETPPDLVLLDMSLPVMDGAEILKRMRNHEKLKLLPVIVLTAHAMPGDEQKFLQLGFNAYVAKPIVNAQPLYEIIDKLLIHS